MPHRFAHCITAVAWLLACSSAASAGTASKVAAGWNHTCAIDAGGGVVCWGSNGSGQLGDTTTTDRATPTTVSSLESGVTAIAAGGAHTCALTTSGGVVCWGSNASGQLGDGTTATRSSPTPVTGLGNGVAAIAAGGWHTCALMANGGVSCWGSNSGGQLGDGTTTQRLTPTAVSGLGTGVAALAAGGEHTCALTTGGGLACWGFNYHGVLGDGTSAHRSTPTPVAGFSTGAMAIAAGSAHTCAVTTSGGAMCWGYNADGRLGDGTTTSRPSPTQVAGLAGGVSVIAAGASHTCALTAGGTPSCWGRNTSGQIGDGTVTARWTPAAVTGIGNGATTVVTGGSHSCALTPGGGIACWGSDYWSQLGDGTVTVRTTPTPVAGLERGAATIRAGAAHSCATTSDAAGACWGDNWVGQLGDGTTTQRSTPTLVSGLHGGVSAVAPGRDHSCALTTGGGVKCWGRNMDGQLGDGTTANRTTPTPVSGLDGGAAGIAAGYRHTCAVTSGGGALCWGYNGNGQLGDGSTTPRLTPTPVSGLGSGVTAVAAGQSHTCALTTGGGVLCWGSNDAGQLGDGTWSARALPTPVSGLGSGVIAIATTWSHTCALTSSGGLWCWGSNLTGQIGDGTTNSRATPTPVGGLANGVGSLAAGRDHTCALTDNGAALCWGSNVYGQLGDGTRTARFTPTPVAGMEHGIAAIGAGENHSCGLTVQGGLLCWGIDERGQLGLGTRLSSSTPLPVYGFGGVIGASASIPAQGPVGGGTSVTLTGAYFLQGASVTIGGVPATRVMVVNTETITATTGAHEPGPADIVVTNPDGTHATLTHGFRYGTADASHTDFTGDLKSDLLWRHSSGGDVWLWPMDGTARAAETFVRTVADATWEIRGLGDFDGDGKPDLLWRNSASGEVYVWPMDGSTPMAETYVATVDPAYDIVGLGDFNGDDKSDLLWRHTTLGDVWVWLMDGAAPKPGGQVYVDRVDPAYVVKGVGDLDANGKTDIVWHHATLGEVWIWPMNGTTRLDQVWVGTVPDTAYQIEGVADFDGNGKADLVWWHATRGEVWLWTMNGTVRQAETRAGTVPDTTYRIAATGDYNGDGKADLLWRNAANGEVWVWLMNGPIRLSETWVATVPDTGYRIVR